MLPVYNPDGSYDYSYSPFREKPNKQLAYAAAAVFIATALVHIIQAFRLKARYMAPAFIGALMEAQFFIVIAPVLVAATQYIILEHIMVHVDAKLSPVRPSLVAKIFVGGDAVSFVVQVAGAGLLVGGSINLIHAANWILIGGLLLQVLSFSCFLALCVVFYLRAARADAERAEDSAALPASQVNPHWRVLFVALMVGSGCVMARSVFRVIEFGAGYDGSIATNEIYMYVFDTILMAVAMYILNFVHPGVALRPVKGAVTEPVEMLSSIVAA
ncbi:hypothetical protein HK405_003266 [Cladochytrium tenue]|nr:hypothetical protein HK405_003266 [Cladochytrium tenue]